MQALLSIFLTVQPAEQLQKPCRSKFYVPAGLSFCDIFTVKVHPNGWSRDSDQRTTMTGAAVAVAAVVAAAAFGASFSVLSSL